MTYFHLGDDVPSHPSSEELASHPSSEELAAYLTGALGAADRESLEAHLLTCRECRRDLTSTQRFLRGHRARRRTLTFAPVVVAAALAFVMISRAKTRDAPEDERLRVSGSGSDTVTSILAVAPEPNAAIDARSAAFVWRSASGKPLYQLSLTDDRGVAVWSVETMDTTVALPASIPLGPGRSYFWTVDALAADGRSLTTRAQRFSIAR